jgi:hypothetical protein
MLEDDQQYFPVETRNSFGKVRVIRVSRQRDPGGKLWKESSKIITRRPSPTRSIVHNNRPLKTCIRKTQNAASKLEGSIKIGRLAAIPTYPRCKTVYCFDEIEVISMLHP